MYKRIMCIFAAMCLVIVSIHMNAFGTVDKCSKRHTVKKDFVKEKVCENGIVADFYYNKSGGKQKAIILLGGSEGGKPWSADYNEQFRTDLLEKGYALLSLAYFGLEGLPGTLEQIPIEYFNKAINWVLKQPGVDNKGVGVIGCSKGGEAALLIASCIPKVKVVVGVVPASNVFQGLGAEVKSSWLFKGKDVPFAPYVYNENYFKAMDLLLNYGILEMVEVHKDALKDPKADRKSAIELEKAEGPVLLLSGKRDTVWASEEMCEKLVERLDDNKFEYYYDHNSFDCGHSVLTEVPDSWGKVLSFFDTHFKCKRK